MQVFGRKVQAEWDVVFCDGISKIAYHQSETSGDAVSFGSENHVVCIGEDQANNRGDFGSGAFCNWRASCCTRWWAWNGRIIGVMQWGSIQRQTDWRSSS